MYVAVLAGHFQAVFAVAANFINDAAAHNFTSHLTDKFLLKQGLTHCFGGCSLPACRHEFIYRSSIGWKSPWTWMHFSLIAFHFFVAVRKGYRIQTDKDRDSMKVLYYVEKELAQFDPARRMRERCEEQEWFDFFFFTDLKSTLQIHSLKLAVFVLKASRI